MKKDDELPFAVEPAPRAWSYWDKGWQDKPYAPLIRSLWNEHAWEKSPGVTPSPTRLRELEALARRGRLSVVQ